MFILNTKLKTLLEVNLAIRKCTIIFKPCIKAVAALFIIGSITFAHATLLDTGNWSQIGQMSSGGGMFNGNLSLTGCTFDDGNDFWVEAPETFAGQELLFITGDDQIWGLVDYASIASIMTTAPNFAPNLAWLDVGFSGSSLSGSPIGKILFRSGAGEDPWVTLIGSHCAHQTSSINAGGYGTCNSIIWGENNWDNSSIHPALKNNSDGVRVFVSRSVPEPSVLALFALGLVGFGVSAKNRKMTRE